MVRIALAILLSLLALRAEAHFWLPFNDGTQLKGSNCAELDALAEAIVAWTLRSGGNPGEAPRCECIGEVCSVSVKENLPKAAASVAGTLSDWDGPNCWNSALVTAGLIPALRTTTSEEFALWLSSPFCRARALGEKPRAGDIIAIRQPDGLIQHGERQGPEVHGMIYLTDDLVYSKNGDISQGHPFALQVAERVFTESYYFTTRECRQPKDAATKASCARWAEYFACTPPEALLSSRAIRVSEEYRALNDKVTTLELRLSRFVVFGKREKKSRARDFDALKPEVMNLLAQAERHAKAFETRNEVSAAERSLWALLVERLRAQKEQFSSLVIPH